MLEYLLILFVPGIGLVLVSYSWYAVRLRQRCLRNLTAATAAEEKGRDELRVPFPKRYRFAAPMVGLMVAGLMAGIVGLPAPFGFATGSLAGVLTWLAESQWASRKKLKIQLQLADAIDLMIGALRAGSALLAALEAALRESREPFRSYLKEVAGRIRLGGDPQAAVRDLALEVPLETFRLFSLSLSVHWEAGGSLASTLSSVAHAIRDRIELSRRIRIQSVEAQVSVVGVVAISYAIAYIMWKANPDSMAEFLQGEVGSFIVSGTICLQALGLLWISRISQIKS